MLYPRKAFLPESVIRTSALFLAALLLSPIAFTGAFAADDEGPTPPEGYADPDQGWDAEPLKDDDQVTSRAVEEPLHKRTGDGYTVYFDTNYFGSGYDALLFEKVDNQHTPPDNGASGMAFTYRGADGKVKQIMSMRGRSVQIGPRGNMGKPGSAGGDYSMLGIYNPSTLAGWGSQAARITSNGQWSTVHMENRGTGQVLWLENQGSGDFLVARDDTRNTQVFWIDDKHVTHARVLEIHGGADLAEDFEVADSGAIADLSNAEPGSVLSIDPAGNGQLIVSKGAYDRTVAGVISGAGGLAAGMVLGVAEEKTENSQPVALSGRVHVRCDTSAGVIRPGDMLTTSDRAGHCMKVTDHQAAQGAILGKAMGSLDDETGLVLTLVSLQ